MGLRGTQRCHGRSRDTTRIAPLRRRKLIAPLTFILSPRWGERKKRGASARRIGAARRGSGEAFVRLKQGLAGGLLCRLGRG